MKPGIVTARERLALTSIKHAVKDSVFALFASTTVIGASASFIPVTAWAQTQAAPGQTRNFDIPAGNLEDALNRLGQEAGILLSFPTELTAGRTSRGLNGRYTVETALESLLAGTGLSAERRGDNRYVLRPAPKPPADASGAVNSQTLRTIKVEDTLESVPEAYAGGQVARGGQLGLLGNRDFMDTPFNQTSYTAALLQDQQARDLADLLRNEPSVREFNTPTQTSWNQWRFRGLRVSSSDFMFEGLGGLVIPATQSMERVEVLKGPSALLNGITPAGAIGGMVNVVPKRASDVPVTQFTATFESEAFWLGHLDVGRRFGEGGAFGVRVNGVYQDGDAFLEEHGQQRSDGVVALDYRGERLRVKLDASVTSQTLDGADSDMFLASGEQVPDAPDADKRFLQPWNHFELAEHLAVLRAEYDLTPNLSVYAAAGSARSRSHFNLSYGINLRESGDFDEVFWGSNSYRRGRSFEAGLNAHLSTGWLDHQLAFKLSRLENESGLISFFDGTIDGSLQTPLANRRNNVFQPSFIAAPQLGGFQSTPPKTAESTLSSVALADTLSFADDRLLLTLGARLQQVESDSFNAQTGAKSAPTYDERAVSPAMGVVFRLRDNISLYGNYIEGLTRGPVAPTTASNAGEVFEPYKSKQIEAGIKFDLGNWATTLNVFELNQPSSLTDSVSRVFSLDGENRFRGSEFTVFGQPVAGIRVLGGATLLDADLVKTNNGTFDGKTSPGTPRFSVNLGGEWDVPFLAGLSLRLFGVYTDSQYIDNANTVELESWTRIDVGSQYAFRAGAFPIVLRAGIENLLDESYWANTSLYRGASRTLLISMTADF